MHRLASLVRAAYEYSTERKGRLPDSLGAAWEHLPTKHRVGSALTYYFSEGDPKLNAIPDE